jgi:hypothetical protein
MSSITSSITRRRTAWAIALMVLVVGAAAGGTGAPAPRTLLGDEVAVGLGTARMFVEVTDDGTPSAVGISLTEGALTGLATHMNTTSRCWDKSGDGRIAHGECLGDYESTLPMPAGSEELDLPFRWSTVNWNPEGHAEPAPHAWSAAHFDFHFFITEPDLIHSIRPGPCAEFIDCEDFERASRALPDHHLPQDYIDVGAAVAGMGNHLIDRADPEIADPSLGFSKTFIYGVYDARMIFLEPMIAFSYLASKPNECAPVKTPATYAVPGYYPTLYCTRYDEQSRTYRVTLEGFVRG